MPSAVSKLRRRERQVQRNRARKAIRLVGRKTVIITTLGVRWALVRTGDVKREIIGLDRFNRPVFQEIDTLRCPYEMVCACGRSRFATCNNIYQIHACRICTEFQRKERKRKH